MISGAHLHLILNHLPVVGSLFALLLLAWGFYRRSDELKRTGLGAVLLVALLTIPTYFTGQPAWEDIMDVPGDNAEFVASHQRAAQIAFAVGGLAGILALVTLVMSRTQRPVPRGMSVVVLILVLATTGLTSWVANLGGKIRHTEIRGGEAGQEEVKK